MMEKIFDTQFIDTQELFDIVFNGKEVKLIPASEHNDFKHYQWSLGNKTSLIYSGFIKHPYNNLDKDINALKYYLFVYDEKDEIGSGYAKFYFTEPMVIMGLDKDLPSDELRLLFEDKKAFFLYTPKDHRIIILGFNND